MKKIMLVVFMLSKLLYNLYIMFVLAIPFTIYFILNGYFMPFYPNIEKKVIFYITRFGYFLVLIVPIIFDGSKYLDNSLWVYQSSGLTSLASLSLIVYCTPKSQTTTSVLISFFLSFLSVIDASIAIRKIYNDLMCFGVSFNSFHLISLALIILIVSLGAIHAAIYEHDELFKIKN